MTYRFTIPTVGSKGRPRFSKRGKFVKVYTDARTLAYERLVAVCARCAGVKPLDGPVALQIRAYFVPGKSIPKKERANRIQQVFHTMKPDLDNICKTVQDALNGIAWNDDAQITTISASKRWGEEEKVEVQIETNYPSPPHGWSVQY